MVLFPNIFVLVLGKALLCLNADPHILFWLLLGLEIVLDERLQLADEDGEGRHLFVDGEQGCQ